ncbi:hypothetical protein GCM10010112_63070 [Actinoplanes lobatus]|uniref:Hyaluronan synthase n=1 Tax=Actinoplanes lobatus TaxID=113568 RepID=A0A7W7MJ66_9ACTN|nr:glycosyltransferase [Actinoplanes lobatus]MBB4752148.1 hyaluronan synthase [Actinoplanes lobatus]GGN84081.1 hypothetical protein GCM10010112_63070 [Actinoplanes lobatus]GIE44085.1 hypothetical protein Alo02nite_69830 [Actinoplanes lobatus]
MSHFLVVWSTTGQTIWEMSWLGLMPLVLVSIFVWFAWIYRVVLSRLARPTVNDFRSSVSVVVPAYREDPDILLGCLDTWLEQNPTEIIVVPDVDDHEVIRRLAEVDDPRLRVIPFVHHGKRSALGIGIRAATGELVVLVDSDTRWLPGLLDAVQMPFADPRVGGVGTQQNVYQRTSSIWRRIADWLVNQRNYDFAPGMGRAGAVSCLIGRTAAYRRSAIMPVLTDLEDEFFLGRRCDTGDDGRLTWLVLAQGYQTVHQSNAKVMSMFSSSFRAFVKQQVRWSRSSFRCGLTALWRGWFWRAPMPTKITVLQIVLTPITLGIMLGYLPFVRLELTAHSIVLVLIWSLFGRGIRHYSHLRRHPQEILLLPFAALVITFVLLPIKVYAFLTMNKQGWLTRTADSIGGEGQTAATLTRETLAAEA